MKIHTCTLHACFKVELSGTVCALVYLFSVHNWWLGSHAYFIYTEING